MKRCNCTFQMPYEELSRLSDGTEEDFAYREMVRRYVVYRWTVIDLLECRSWYLENTGFLQEEIVDETAVEVADDTVTTATLLGFIRAREGDQLRRFGAEHLTAFARHDAASTASLVPFKLLFGLPVTTERSEYEDACLYDSAVEDFWDP